MLPPKKIPELLAPAGTLPAFEAALAAGADAVYIGAPGLNARALARDFNWSEIAAMTAHAQCRKKKLYVALNSLVKEEEIPLALTTLWMLAKIKPDALIIQDMGMLYLARQFFPELPLHASTLMTVNNALAAAYCKDLGFERVVLARELSLEEIHHIHRQTDAALEIFIHGAMCFSYSGLCRFSSLHGGKSSLRGQCVQPCRRRYDWLPSGKGGSSGKGSKGGGYLFSMNDLCGIDHLAAIREAGVVSLKIEGRLKPVVYVRNTVRAYRLALDALDAPPSKQTELLAEAHQCLDAAMGRKRSSGFFVAGQEERIISPWLSGSSGEVLGKVLRLEIAKPAQARKPTPISKGGNQRTATVALVLILKTGIRLGDRLRLYEERSGKRISFTLRTLTIKGRKVEQAEAGQTVAITLTDMEPGMLRQPFQGILFRVDVGGRVEKTTHSGPIRGLARPAPGVPDPAILEKILAGLGIETEMPMPEATSKRETTRPRLRASQHSPNRGHVSPEWWLKLRSLDALRQRYPFPIAKVLLDLNPHNLGTLLQARPSKAPRQPPLVWTLPPIIREEDLAWYQEAIQRLRHDGARCFQISHSSQMALFAASTEKPLHPSADQQLELYGDYSCNVLNSAALRLHAANGLSGVQFSLETDRATLAAALNHFAQAQSPMRVGLYVHGRPPLFSARLDAPHFAGQRSFASPHGERLYLDRDAGSLYAFSHITFSLLPYREELSRMGIDYLVVDLSQGQPKKECAELTTLYKGRGDLPPVFSGNYPGTLA
jgi:putative protease